MPVRSQAEADLVRETGMVRQMGVSEAYRRYRSQDLLTKYFPEDELDLLSDEVSRHGSA